MINKLPLVSENVELLLHTLKQLDEEHERKVKAGEINENDDNENNIEAPLIYNETRLGENEERFKRYDLLLKQLVIDTKKNTSERIDYLIQESDENAGKFVDLWQLRENYRLDVEKKNQSLLFLLNKTKEAIQTCRDIDNPPVDNKKKKK